MESINCCSKLVVGLRWLVHCLSLGYDHFIQRECPEWSCIIFAFANRAIVRCLLCQLLLSPLQVFLAKLFFFAHCWFALRLKISARAYDKIVLPGTAYPVTLCVLSCCQLNMHFCNLCGISLSLALWKSLKCKCWYFVRNIFSPIYDYTNARLKRPPDGTITSTIILSTMLIVNLITMIHGLCFISLF